MGGALTDIFEQGRLHPIWVRNMKKLAGSTSFMDAQKQTEIANKSFIKPIVAFVEKHFDRILEKVCFEKALEQQLTNKVLMQISPPHLNSMPSESETRISSSSKQSVSSDKEEEKEENVN